MAAEYALSQIEALVASSSHPIAVLRWDDAALTAVNAAFLALDHQPRSHAGAADAPGRRFCPDPEQWQSIRAALEQGTDRAVVEIDVAGPADTPDTADNPDDNDNNGAADCNDPACNYLYCSDNNGCTAGERCGHARGRSPCTGRTASGHGPAP